MWTKLTNGYLLGIYITLILLLLTKWLKKGRSCPAQAAGQTADQGPRLGMFGLFLDCSLTISKINVTDRPNSLRGVQNFVVNGWATH